ncbi:MMPL family transporter [Parahaliea aestuarii]|uniref:MMPL family transporter n=1 Tax=Parahaliea aestuarii TaxID=1852021 RepID=A0A5C8ZT13_9GAMM|nr:MMPL family transporter [Parahaliea aestuarii]TXS90451.1 MMPL family transporter [Parahaliea aestuarii]
MTSPETRRGLWLWLLGATLLLALAWLRWPGQWLQTDIMTLLPRDQDLYWQQRAEAQQASAYERRLLLWVKDTDPQRADDHAQRFLESAMAALDNAGFETRDVLSAEQQRWQATARALTPWRFALLTGGDQQRLAQDPAGLLTDYRHFLYSPLGGAGLVQLRQDPAGSFRRFLSAAAPASPGGDGAALAVLELSPAGIALNRLEPLYPLYRSLREEARAQGLQMRASGAPLYTAYGIHSARGEISSIGFASLALLAVLLWLALRSARALLLTLLCVSSGLTAGILVSVSLLGQVHLLALVFSATLIGIAADYALHYLAHSLAPGWQRQRPLARVGRALGLGALSSVLAFGALALLPFPGLRQIGLLMASGLAVSFATVCLLFPALYRPREGRNLPPWCRRPLPSARSSRVILAMAALLCLPGLLLLQPGDDVRSFYAAPASLEADREALSQLAPAGADSRYVLLLGPDTESLLQAEEALRTALDTPLQGISQFIPSRQQQQSNLALWQAPAVRTALTKHLEQLGMKAPDRQQVLASLQAPGAALTPDALPPKTLPTGGAGLLGCNGGQCASVLIPAGELAPSDLEQIRQFAGASLVDPVARVNGLLGHYRHLLSALLPAAAVLVAIVLGPMLGWRRALWAVGLPACACLFGLGLLGYLTALGASAGSFNLAHLLGLMLVLGVGLDYGVFRNASAADHQGATTLAVSLSALTSLLAFGMLALSRTPFIASFGLSIALGLLAAWGLSWLNPGDRPPPRP